MAEEVVQHDFHADRQVEFDRSIVWLDRDFTGATFFMQVRPVKDTTGTPLVDMHNGVFGTDDVGIQLTYAGTATITAHIAAGRLDEVPDAINPATGSPYVGTDNVLLSVVRFFIDYLTMRALPFPAERGDDLTLYHDAMIAPTGGLRDVELAGMFIVRAGVSVP